MNTEKHKLSKDPDNTSLWGSLVGLVCLGNAVSALLRISGLRNTSALLLQYGVSAWKPAWLLCSAFILLTVNLISWLCLWKRRRAFVGLTWLAFALNFLAYWSERFFVWARDQRFTGNFVFMLFLFGLYLALMVLFTLDLRKKKMEQNAGRN
ncbi:MAG: hypothetical protein VB108_04410 [Anaerolineaceae bacterium]|nr:hypothetical protein [Anaerolineaceae bacterium]